MKPWLLFTCEEEVGGIGADNFCLAYEQGRLPAELDALKFLVEIDRKGKNDAVFYDCDNSDFEAYIAGKGFVTAQGSFSDISVIAPTLDVAAVNLSSGYYNAHRLHEYIVRSELEHTIQKVCEIVAEGLGSCNSRERRYLKTDFATNLNTILKMAKKRAFVDAILTATHASKVFTQDIEDIVNYQREMNDDRDNTGR